MRAYHVAGFLALFFWQSAPFHVSTAHGRFHLSFAAATGQWEDYFEYTDCNGNVTRSGASKVPMESYGGRGDVFLGDGRIRITAVAGRSSADSAGVGQGTFWGAGAAWEGPGIGFGVGYRHAGNALRPDAEDLSMLAGYWRLGRLDPLHLRLELGPLSETPSLAGEARAGLAFGEGPRQQLSGFIGVVAGPSMGYDEMPWGMFGDFGIPIVRGGDLLLRAVFAPGHQIRSWGLGAGMRARF